MKRIIWGIIGIPVAIGLIYGIGYIFQFAFFLVQIDNTEFGFPPWLDIVIDIIAGIITYIFVLSLLNLSKTDKETLSQVCSIIIGFAISCLVHIFLRYWYVVLTALALFITTTFVVKHISKVHEVKKEKTDESI